MTDTLSSRSRAIKPEESSPRSWKSTSATCGRRSVISFVASAVVAAGPVTLAPKSAASWMVWNRKRRTNRRNPPVDRRPRRKVLRQHPPAAGGAGQISDRIQNLAQIRPGRPPALGRARQERLNPRPLLVGQIRRVALGLLLKFDHPATRRWGPHPKLESRPNGL